jgi:GNAT superfamily N-acetyltransferase
MRVVGQRLIDIPNKIYKKLYSLNMRRAGEMQKTLRELRLTSNETTFIHYILEDNKLMGWTMAVRVKSWYDDVEGYFNHFYVRKHKRKHGYGEALLRAANLYCVRKDKSCIVSNWDTISSSFFNNTANKFGLKLVYRDVLSFNWKNIQE